MKPHGFGNNRVTRLPRGGASNGDADRPSGPGGRRRAGHHGARRLPSGEGGLPRHHRGERHRCAAIGPRGAARSRGTRSDAPGAVGLRHPRRATPPRGDTGRRRDPAHSPQGGAGSHQGPFARRGRLPRQTVLPQGAGVTRRRHPAASRRAGGRVGRAARRRSDRARSRRASRDGGRQGDRAHRDGVPAARQAHRPARPRADPHTAARIGVACPARHPDANGRHARPAAAREARRRW